MDPTAAARIMELMQQQDPAEIARQLRKLDEATRVNAGPYEVFPAFTRGAVTPLQQEY
jgi:hypothetical protein